MSYKGYKNEETYRASRKRDRERYYGSTQKYEKRDWTGYEDNMIVLNIKTMSTRQLSDLLKRSVKSIEHRKSRLRAAGRLEKIERQD